MLNWIRGRVYIKKSVKKSEIIWDRVYFSSFYGFIDGYYNRSKRENKGWGFLDREFYIIWLDLVYDWKLAN